jgi:hypothetical protein
MDPHKRSATIEIIDDRHLAYDADLLRPGEIPGLGDKRQDG